MHIRTAASTCFVGLALVTSACGAADTGTSSSHATSSSSASAGGAGGSGDTGGAGGGAPELVWGKCDTTNWVDGFPTPPASVKCTTVDVPADHSLPNGPTITLQVARQKAASNPTNKALFELSGGPGGSAVVDSAWFGMALPNIASDHDLVYVDLRGTGGSHYLDCPNGYPATSDDWLACATSLASEPLDHDLSLDAAADLDLVRTRLGYGQIALYGSSYGTRTGLEYLRQHSDHVEVAVLDGIAPPDVDLFDGDVRAFSVGVALLESDCTADPACLAVSPTLDTDLKNIYAARIASPEPVLINGHDNVENGDNFKQLLQAFLYDATQRYEIPRAIHLAAQGDRSEWYAMAAIYLGKTFVDNPGGNLTAPSPLPLPFARPPFTHGHGPVAPGLFGTVSCAEVFPNSGGVAVLAATEAAQPWISTQSELDFVSHCDAWPVHPIDASLRTPVSSDVPVLLLSGGIDLQTFPSNGDHAAATLSHGTHLVIPFATHGTIETSCGRTVLQGFIEKAGDMSQVDKSCVAALTHPAW